MERRTAERVGTSSGAKAVRRSDALWLIVVMITVPALLFAPALWRGWDRAFATTVVVDVGLLVFALLATGCAVT